MLGPWLRARANPSAVPLVVWNPRLDRRLKSADPEVRGVTRRVVNSLVRLSLYNVGPAPHIISFTLPDV